MKQKQKGSVLAYSLIIISLMLIVATGVALTATIDRKSTGVTNKSSQAYQAAESSAEVFIRDMGAASTIADLNNAEHPCDAATGFFQGTILETGGSAVKDYSIALYTGNVRLNCQSDSAQLITSVSKIVAMGKYGDTERDVEISLQSALPDLPAPAGCGINTCEELVSALETDPSGTHRLCDHIDCAGVGGFPISADFSGTLDGESATPGSNFTISNLSADNATQAGMFKNVATGGIVKNLNFSNIVVHGTRNVGGIASEAVEGSSIENIEIHGLNMLVDGDPGGAENVMAGGAVGECYRCNLNKIVANGLIQYMGQKLSGGYAEIGGIVGNLNRENPFAGSMNAQQLASSVAISHGGDVSDSMLKAGGLIGKCEKGAVIRNSYASGTLTTFAGTADDHQFYLGGFIGGAKDCIVESSYARVGVSGPGGLFRGFIGFDDPTGPTSASNGAYWSTDAVASGGCAACGGRTDALLKTSSTFSGWDSTTIWRITDGNYPCLRGVTC